MSEMCASVCWVACRAIQLFTLLHARDEVVFYFVIRNKKRLTLSIILNR